MASRVAVASVVVVGVELGARVNWMVRTSVVTMTITDEEAGDEDEAVVIEDAAVVEEVTEGVVGTATVAEVVIEELEGTVGEEVADVVEVRVAEEPEGSAVDPAVEELDEVSAVAEVVNPNTDVALEEEDAEMLDRISEASEGEIVEVAITDSLGNTVTRTVTVAVA